MLQRVTLIKSKTTQTFNIWCCFHYKFISISILILQYILILLKLKSFAIYSFHFTNINLFIKFLFNLLICFANPLIFLKSLQISSSEAPYGGASLQISCQAAAAVPVVVTAAPLLKRVKPLASLSRVLVESRQERCRVVVKLGGAEQKGWPSVILLRGSVASPGVAWSEGGSEVATLATNLLAKLRFAEHWAPECYEVTLRSCCGSSSVRAKLGKKRRSLRLLPHQGCEAAQGVLSRDRNLG